MSKNDIPLWHKTLLSIDDAARLTGVGSKRIRQLIETHEADEFVLAKGSHVLIKRRLFEEFLEKSDSI